MLDFKWQRSAMAVAMAQPLWNPKQMKTWSTLHLRICAGTHIPMPNTNSTLSSSITLHNTDNANANFNSVANICTSDDVKRLCNEGSLKDTLHVFLWMGQQGIRPDSSTYSSVLQECVHNKSLSHGKLIHAHMIHSGFNPDSFLQTKLLIMYAKCGSRMDARQLFDKMAQRNVVAWNAMISAYAKHGQSEEALTLYYQMQREGIKPDKFTFASVIPACANLESLKHGKEVYENITRAGIQSDIFVGSALIKLYAKCGRIEEARRVFDAMAERDVVSWTAMIARYAQNGQVDEAFALFQKMPERDLISWNAMIVGCAQNGEVEEALKLFQKMPYRNVISWNAMVTGNAQNGQVEDAFKLFQKIPDRDLVSWNAMIAGYAQNGKVDKALKLFQKMPDRDVVSWNSMIAGYTQNGQVNKALKLFQEMSESDRVSWNAMIAGYAQNGQVDEALKLFQKMPERNDVSWTLMIGGCAQNGNVDEALKLFQQMQHTGVKPDSVTFTSLLPACTNLASLKNGKEVHGSIIRSGFQWHISVENALVDMYAKCGSIEDAIEVFDKMPDRDIVSWNAMIVGYAKNGYGKEALQHFEQMQHSGTKPNHVTFIGVLSACSHAGLVDDGWEYFDRMSQDYYITPLVEHYCCMVDLLGRAGQLNEAIHFINKMPIKPNADMWGSLLGACRIHKNIELGEHVAQCLLDLDPKNSACYVLLSNIYATAGRWDDVEKVRKMMKERSIKKIPGCSWIEVNNKMYSFIMGDRADPQMHKIYAELERLSWQMKEAGYVPDTNLVLHDVEEQQKEHILFHHSEKLAIVFGLIHASPGTPIRIAKNLRVCSDCHLATKFISKIVAREIVVRDANRFHHFKDGQCSCGDYW